MNQPEQQIGTDQMLPLWAVLITEEFITLPGIIER
jgi:hypothetical protein